MTATFPFPGPDRDDVAVIDTFAFGGPRTSPAEAAGLLRARYPGPVAPADDVDLAAAAAATHLWMVALAAGSLQVPARFGTPAVRALARAQLRAAGAPSVRDVPAGGVHALPSMSLCAEIEDLMSWLSDTLGADAGDALQRAAADLSVDDQRLAAAACGLLAAGRALDTTAGQLDPHRR